ncbi:MAG: hypothetical protein HPY76_15105 [Anaerolineae bacterium]|nr:hypothetical protein [Anaerolineae bacterium]
MSAKQINSADRSPVLRKHAEDYLLIMLLCFAASVSGTRLFLELTGYPQLGSGELHIAHVLWGGLCLYIACLFPIIFANRWAFYWSSALTGIGIGLFIDEVGKFITSENDYFYPAAAPIIYALFILSVLLFTFIKNSLSERNSRAKFYDVLQTLEEIVDRDLSQAEYQALMESLSHIAQHAPNESVSLLVRQLADNIPGYKLLIVEEKLPPIKKIINWLKKIESLYFTRRRNHAVISGGLFAWGVWAISYPLSVIVKIRSPQELQAFLSDLVSDQLIRGTSGLTWFQIRIGLEGGIGIIIIISAFLLLLRKEKIGIPLAISATLMSISIINLLIFYFDQFSTIIVAAFQFVLLLLLIRYRNRFLNATA